MVPSILTGVPIADEAGNYGQFVNTQAYLLMNSEQRLAKIVDDLAGRNLAFFSGRPRNRHREAHRQDRARRMRMLCPRQILREAIARKDIFAGHVANSELMAVTMSSRNLEEAKTIVNSFLRNYVGQYTVDSTTSESQDITTLENRRNEIQKRIREVSTTDSRTGERVRLDSS